MYLYYFICNSEAIIEYTPIMVWLLSQVYGIAMQFEISRIDVGKSPQDLDMQERDTLDNYMHNLIMLNMGKVVGSQIVNLLKCTVRDRQN